MVEDALALLEHMLHQVGGGRGRFCSVKGSSLLQTAPAVQLAPSSSTPSHTW